MISQVIDQSVFCHFCKDHLNVFYTNKQIVILKIYCHNIMENFEKIQQLTFITSNGGSYGALLVDLSQSFYCIVHDLYWQKRSAYGFDYKSLNLTNSFLSGKKFRTKIGSSYDPWVSLKDQSWVLCFLIHRCATFFYAIANLTSL